ncbi:MAG: transposase, family [Clostridiales bacterium]|jgi:hypothetical protein|nr:transposase, family [Clostridiales bacterium]
MQGKDTINSTFNLLFSPIINKIFNQQLSDLEVDEYVKKLKTLQMIKLIAFAQLEQQQGLRDISNNLNNDDFSKAMELDSISASQLSRRLRDLPTELTESLFKSVALQAAREIGSNSLRQNLGQLYLIDSTTISLCLSQYPWAYFRKTKAGIKVHLRLKFHDKEVLPDKAIITPAKPAEKTQMNDLVVEEEDALNVFDRAYVDYKKFGSYCEKGIRFVSRLKSNSLVEVVEELPLNLESNIKKDQLVYLGKDRTTKMNHLIRLIETEDSEGNPVIIITNDFELAAEEISDIYRNRWQIEIFFRWLKQNFHVKHFYRLSLQAVENQLFIALTAYCLLVLLLCRLDCTISSSFHLISPCFLGSLQLCSGLFPRAHSVSSSLAILL